MDFLNAPGSGAILLAILLIGTIAYKLFNKGKVKEEVEETREENNNTASPLNLNDEDAVVASLIASIECRNEYHKNVQVISVREVK